MHHVTFIQDLAVVMIIAALVTILFHRFKQPVVLGYILAGVIIGPNTPPYPLIENRETIETFAELGVIFLMFSLGLHFSLRQLKQVGATAFIAAFLEILFMIGIGYVLGQVFGWNNMDSLFLGAILSISSTTIIVKVLEELRLSRERFAELIFGILIVEDILAIALLALLSGVAVTGSMSLREVGVTVGELLVFLVAVLVVGLLLIPRLLRYVARFKSDEMLLVTSLGLCFGVSLLAARLEYSVALGAFISGAVIAEAREAGRIQVLVAPVRDLFSAIFFVAVGMLIDPHTLVEYAGPILAITAAVVVGKVITCSFGTLIAGNDLRTSLRVGMGLAQIGEFSFIIASLGQTLEVTGPFLYPIAVTVSAITTLLTPYLIRSSDPLIAWFERVAPRTFLEYLTFYRHSIQGIGRDGSGLHANRLLRRAGIQMFLNTVLMTGLFIIAKWYAGRPLAWPSVPTWTGGPPTFIWLGAALLALPLFIATFRKLQAVGMMLAEMRVARSSPTRNVNAARVLIANTLLIAGTTALCLWLLLVSSALLPPWPVLLVLVGIIVVIMRVLWSPFVQLYTTAQVALRETLEDTSVVHDPAETPAEPVLPSILADARINMLELSDEMPAVGNLIRELRLRTLTGATIIGIERAGSPTVNPDPDEELQPGDKVLLLGTEAQLQAAQRFMVHR